MNRIFNRHTLILKQILVSFCICLTLFSCGKSSNSDTRQTIKFWHFWSEPRQKAVLQEQIALFEQLNPAIHVELTDLQWSDGKTKLMLGFNAHTAPDVVHLGFEWMPEFIGAGVLAPLSDSLAKDTADYFSPALQSLVAQKKLFALPWTMNTRAMMISKHAVPTIKLFGEQGKSTWDMLREIKKHSGISVFWGVNSAEPHNVLKKALPIIWSAGSNLFASVPLSKSFDSAAIVGLKFYLEMCEGGVQEQSRKLDDLFLQDRVATWITGQWILDKAKDLNKDSSFIVIGEIPTKNHETIGYSILGGDCLALSSQSKQSKSAEKLIQFLTAFKQSSVFCNKVSDAGFPATKQVFTPEYYERLSHHYIGFLKQIEHSRPLPSSPIFLDAERILEEEIMNAVYKKKSAKDALQSAKERIETIENKSR